MGNENVGLLVFMPQKPPIEQMQYIPNVPTANIYFSIEISRINIEKK